MYNYHFAKLDIALYRKTIAQCRDINKEVEKSCEIDNNIVINGT